MTVRQLRVVLHPDDLDAALAFYRDRLGLIESEAFAGPDGARVVILAAGAATLELTNPAQARYIAAVETGGVPSTPVRLAFEVADTTATTAALTAGGAPLVAAPVLTPWNSRNARLDGPGGVHVTIFQELGEPAGLVGSSVAALGGEPGLLARTVALADAHAAAGGRPFAAVVARAGTVIGAGVNSVEPGLDPTAHGEIVAIRDAARRTGTVDLAGAVVYSSCEPCAICRTVAATAGVAEIVYAAGKELVPREFDPDPAATARLIDAVAAVLPRIARRGETGLDVAGLTAPFRTYLAGA